MRRGAGAVGMMTAMALPPLSTEPPPAPPGSPWRTTAVQPQYANAWISVREDAVVRPDGAPGIYGVVSFRNRALGAVPLLADGSTVLVGQHRYTLDSYTWEIPEGGGDPSLPAQHEMARELREETGLVGRRWLSLGAIHTSNSVTDELGHLWLVEDLEEGPTDPEGTEVLQRWRLPFPQAVEMAGCGALTDSLTVAGLLRAARVLERRSPGGEDRAPTA
jgi:8-oxo-dGTP pyrophosphatase MutT (NUDIX family)